MKHLKVRQEYSTARRIFNSLLSVSVLGNVSKKSEIKTGKRPISENQFSKIGLFLVFLSFSKIDRKLSVT